MYILYLVVITLVLYFLHKIYKDSVNAKRESYINNYIFPLTIKKKLLEKYPHLSDNDLYKVMTGLRQYFHICNMARHRFVSMPSQVVDVAWHEFILFTANYAEFCNKAFGRFLHHSPAETMQQTTIAQDGIKRAWKLCCVRQKIDPKAPLVLPLLFALDSQLNISDGFFYTLDCTKNIAAANANGDTYCASHIGCGGGSSCGGSSCGSGNSGGDSGGSSCGGGCGGGGD